MTRKATLHKRFSLWHGDPIDSIFAALVVLKRVCHIRDQAKKGRSPRVYSRALGTYLTTTAAQGPIPAWTAQSLENA